jgi:hypothetical protein
MSSQLSAVPQHPLGAVPPRPSGRLDAVPYAPQTGPHPEDRLARITYAALGVVLASASVALTYLTLTLH